MQLDRRTVREENVAKIRLEYVLVGFFFLYYQPRSFPRFKYIVVNLIDYFIFMLIRV